MKWIIIAIITVFGILILKEPVQAFAEGNNRENT